MENGWDFGIFIDHLGKLEEVGWNISSLAGGLKLPQRLQQTAQLGIFVLPFGNLA
jgi:hypothetical protein